MAETIEQVLVLNKSWVAIATTNPMRAISLAYRGHARMVDGSTYEVFEWSRWLESHNRPVTDGAGGHVDGWIRTPRMLIRQPEVITLATYGGVPARTLPFSRRLLYRRDDHKCQYCGHAPGSRQLTIDHVMPRSRGGPTDWLNCVVACVQCNVRKGARTPEEAGIRLNRTPYKPSILEGFRVGGQVPPAWAKFIAGSQSSV